MAIRQYIGARYVPRFMGTYDATQIYEALDVVDNGSGTSYIARKTTPAGTPLTDTDYWFVYGASSGAILQLQQDVADLKDEKTDNMKERRFCIIGDSYCVQGGAVLAPAMMTALGVDAANYDVFANGSYGFIGSVPGCTFLSLAQLVTNPEKYTDVIILGGHNDRSQTDAALLSAALTLDTYIKANFTNVKRIYLGFIAARIDDSGMYSLMKTVYGQYNMIAKELGHIYLHGVHMVALNPAYWASGDVVHPIAAGLEEIGKQCAQAILTGISVNNWEKLISVTVPSAATVWAGQTFNIRVYCKDNNISIYFGQLYAPKTTNDINETVIASFTDFNILPIPDEIVHQQSDWLQVANMSLVETMKVNRKEIKAQILGWGTDDTVLTGRNIRGSMYYQFVGSPY